MTKRLKRRLRGVTLLELLTASAILVVGLVGIIELLIRSADTNRQGAQVLSATALANSTLADLSGLGFNALDAGTFTQTKTDSVGRTFDETVTIVDASDGGYPAYAITVQVDWKDVRGQPHTNFASTIVSQVPALDGGP
ncbi:MAG: hypothetical protein AB1938_01575 [Myxococcota bacterium]